MKITLVLNVTLCYFVMLCYTLHIYNVSMMSATNSFFETVPFDLTGVHPRPRQAKAMVSSNLLSPPLLLLLFFFSSSFPLQTPPHLSLNNCHLSHSVSHLLNTPVQVQHPDHQHLQTETLPLLTLPATHLLFLLCLPPKDPAHHYQKISLCSRVCARIASSTVTWSRQGKSPNISSTKLNFPFFRFFFSEFQPPIPWFHMVGSCLGMASLWP